MSECTSCELHCARKQIVYPTPCQPGGLLVIGEAPGADEDEAGEGFVGQSGKVLDALLRKHGLRRGMEYGVANIARCRPPNNRKPTSAEKAACLPHLADSIISIRPKALLLVGGTAISVILGGGSVFVRVQQSRESAFCDYSFSHAAFAGALKANDPALFRAGIIAIPTPHTSGLAWNRTAADGRRWSEIGDEQVAMAARYLAD